jgi:hypothetical protein
MADELRPNLKHSVTNRVRDPEGNVLSEMRAEIGIEAESARPDWLAGMPIHVVHGAPPGAEPT